MNRAAIDLWVGFFVALGLGALLFLALKVGSFTGVQMDQTYQLQAKFDNIGGLKVRAAVKSAGVVVGRVSEIRFDPEAYLAVVTLQVDGRYKFPRDTFFSRGDRASILRPANLTATSSADDLYPGRSKVELRFELPRGTYATMVVKQIMDGQMKSLEELEAEMDPEGEPGEEPSA